MSWVTFSLVRVTKPWTTLWSNASYRCDLAQVAGVSAGYLRKVLILKFNSSRLAFSISIHFSL